MSNNLEAEIHERMRALPPLQRLNVAQRELGDALVNVGPEKAREITDQLVGLVDAHTRGTMFEAVGDAAEGWLTRLKSTRFMHWLGKGPVLVVLAVAVLVVCVVVGGVLLGVWDAPTG